MAFVLNKIAPKKVIINPASEILCLIEVKFRWLGCLQVQEFQSSRVSEFTISLVEAFLDSQAVKKSMLL